MQGAVAARIATTTVRPTLPSFLGIQQRETKPARGVCDNQIHNYYIEIHRSFFLRDRFTTARRKPEDQQRYTRQDPT